MEEIYWNDHTIEEGNEINSVLLKTMTEGTGERYYFVRPGQRLRREKFLSKTLRLTYCRVKALKKILVAIQLKTNWPEFLLDKPLDGFFWLEISYNNKRFKNGS